VTRIVSVCEHILAVALVERRREFDDGCIFELRAFLKWPVVLNLAAQPTSRRRECELA
jgi:hypothetical protein